MPSLGNEKNGAAPGFAQCTRLSWLSLAKVQCFRDRPQQDPKASMAACASFREPRLSLSAYNDATDHISADGGDLGHSRPQLGRQRSCSVPDVVHSGHFRAVTPISHDGEWENETEHYWCSIEHAIEGGVRGGFRPIAAARPLASRPPCHPATISAGPTDCRDLAMSVAHPDRRGAASMLARTQARLQRAA